MENEEGWNFNAPQYVDFESVHILKDDDNADEYFDYDHENGVPVNIQDEADSSAVASDIFSTPQSEVKRVTRSSVQTPRATVTQNAKTPQSQKSLRSKTPTATISKKETPVAVIDSEHETETKGVETVQTPSPRVTRSGKPFTPNTVEKEYAQQQKKKEKPNNICTNLDEWKKKTSRSQMVKNSKHEAPAANENVVKPVMKREHRSLERSDSLLRKAKPSVPERGRTPNKAKSSSNLQRSCSFSTLRNGSADSARSRNHTRGLSGERPSAQRPRANSNSSNKSAPEQPKVHVTVPTTPTLLKRKPVKSQTPVKNSEQLEMEKIAYYRQELAKKRKLAQESCKAALSAKQPTCVVQKQELTKPESFKFETDSRIKTHGMETRHDTEGKDFISSLRSDKGKPTNGPMKAGITKPEPFKLTEQRKRRLPDLDQKQAEKYETMAERLAQFTKTPERFRSRSKPGPTEQKRGRSKSPPITVPKTPQFETRTRGRPVTAPSREDLEMKEIEEMQKNQFKAKPVNAKIFNNPHTGVKKVPARPPTVPEEFHLSSKNKALDKDHGKGQDEHFAFHAQPLNKKILEGTVGVKEAKKLPVTIPESPAFALKHRARIPVVEEPKEEKPHLRTRGVPHFGIPFQPQIEHKATEPEPFGFEERERKRAEEKRRKIAQALEEEKKQREFHANPVPDLEPHLPPKRTRPLTVKQPFQLDTDIRGAKKAEEWSKKMDDELQQQKEKAKFRAKNATVLEQEPFIPHKENKYTVDISEFEFNTAKRTVKREAFEMHKKAKQDELDDIRRQEEKMREAEEQAELERLRREAVHKAQPVKHYKTVQIRPSDKPLTAPMSPHFKTDTRLRTRAQHAESFMSA